MSKQIKMVKTLVAFAVVVGCVLAFPSSEIDSYANWRIIGGAPAKEGQFPHQVSFRFGNVHWCSGSILNEKWVLTAASCVDDALLLSSLTMVVGTTKPNESGVKYSVMDLVIHPEWDMIGNGYNIALVKSASKIVLGEKVKAIPLGKEIIGEGVDVVLSGWGDNTFPVYSINELQFINLKTINNSKCVQMHAPDHKVYETQICTLTKIGEGTCFGDSGSGLTANSELVGIVLWGKPCAVGYPDVYTRVSSFVEWVGNNAK